MTIGYKYAVVLPKLSGLPRDEVVNDFYTNTVLDLADVTTAIHNFYLGVGSYFAPSMSGVVTINQYAIPDSRPAPGIGFGPPIGSNTTTLYGPATNGLPAQCACVLTFHADFTGIPEHGPSGTRPRATRRGRVFLGELSTSTVTSETTGTKDTEFLDVFLSTVASNASSLMHTPSLGWSVFSKKNWALYPVVGGWVDDSPDVTRRRKIDADSRTTWS